jgi:uncharacterized protein involved in exopolysaccharide biosynthesis
MSVSHRELIDQPRAVLEPLEAKLHSPGGPAGHFGSSPSVRWLASLLDHRRSLLVAALAGAVVSAGLAARRPITYTAAAQVIVESRRASTQLSDLAAQLGWGSFSGEGAPPPQFYADLMTSRLVLGTVLDSTYTFVTDSGPVRARLLDIMEAEGRNPALQREAAIRILRQSVSKSVAARTGVISIAVATRYPALSPLVVDALIAEVNRINIESRQSQAGGEREFTGRRMAEAAAELRSAERALQSFLEQNRAYRSAPRTVMEEDRLSRAVAMRQAIYTSVAHAYEQARIDEARDTPLLRVVEPPTVPVIPNPRGRVRAAVFGFLLAGSLMLLVVMAREYLARAAKDDPEGSAHLREELREAGAELLRPWRLFRRRRKDG